MMDVPIGIIFGDGCIRAGYCGSATDFPIQFSIPSYAAYTEGGWVVGNEAIDQEELNAIHSVELLIGRKFNDPEVTEAVKHLPYTVVSNSAQNILIEVETSYGTKKFTPEVILAVMLQEVKADVENTLSADVTGALISVPIYFNDSQRQATVDAAKIAGFRKVQLINEPAAAAFTYPEWSEEETTEQLVEQKPKKFVIVTFGDETMDASLVTTFPNRGRSMNVEVVSHYHYGVGNISRHIRNYVETDVRAIIDIEQRKGEVIGIAQGIKKHMLLFPYSDWFEIRSQIELTAPINGEQIPYTLGNEACREIISILEEMMLYLADVARQHAEDILVCGAATQTRLVQSLVKKVFGGNLRNWDCPEGTEVIYGAAKLAVNEFCAAELDKISIINILPWSLRCEIAKPDIYYRFPKGRMIPWGDAKEYDNVKINSEGTLTIEVFEVYGIKRHPVGKFTVSGITAGPPTITLGFEVNQSGIFSLIASQENSRGMRDLAVKAEKGGLSQDAIDRGIGPVQEDGDAAGGDLQP